MTRIFLPAFAVFFAVIQGFALTIYAPKAPPTIPLLKTAEALKNVRIVLYNDVQTEVLPKILKENGNLYVIPSNIAAKLYNKGVPIQVLGVTSLGLLYLLSGDPAVKSIEDLDGIKVSIGEPGSSPDAIARFLFNKKGVKPVIVYGSTPSIAQYLIGGKIKTAVLPEPYATMALSRNPSVRRIGDFRRIWESTVPGSAGMPQTVLAGKAGFIAKQKPEIEEFIRQYQESISWTFNVPKTSSRFGVDKLGLNMKAEALEKSFFFMNLTFMGGKDARASLTGYFKSMMETDRESVGENIPDEKFYAKYPE